MKAVLAVVSLGIAVLLCAVAALGQDARPASSDAGPASVLNPANDAAGGAVLGEPFESLGLGIALRGPAGSRVIRQVGGTEVDFVHEKNKWNLKVARLTLDQPMPLESSKDAEGKRKVGLLEVTVDRLKDQMPGAAILRNDLVRVGQVPVGMIALRYVKGLETLLSQQAIVRANDRLYFTLTLTSPGSKASGNEAGDDPAERKAVETFGEVLDTIRLLDQKELVRDQEDRVYASLAMLVNLGGKGRLESKLIPKQWFRLQRKGKDIGYVYSIEEVGDGIPGDANAPLRSKKASRRAGPDGILIGTRSRTTAGENARADAESWMFCSNDRRLEEWSTLQVVQDLRDAAKFDHTTIVGSSSWRTGVRLDRKAHEQGLRGEKDDPNQPPVRQTNDHVLNVTHASKSENFEPLNQSLPDYYLPQALSQLLPRLLPTDQPKKYLFAVYVPEVRAVMHRYVDVGEEKRVNFGGQTVRAVPITDRVGLEGSVTTHYVGVDGKYLGSENPDTGIVVLPSDEATLTGIWKDADLTRPADVKRDAKPAAASAPPAAPAGGAIPTLPASTQKPIRQPTR
jgi:hypothetical protein